MKLIHNLKFIIISILLAFGIAACDNSGPAEAVGENIDKTVDNVDEKMSDAAIKVEESIDKVEEQVEDSISDKEK